MIIPCPWLKPLSEFTFWYLWPLLCSSRLNLEGNKWLLFNLIQAVIPTAVRSSGCLSKFQSWFPSGELCPGMRRVRLHLATLAASVSISRQSRPDCIEQEVSKLVTGSLRFTRRPYLGNPVYVYISLSYLILIPWEQFYNSVYCKWQAYKFCPVWYEFYWLPSVSLCHQRGGVVNGGWGGNSCASIYNSLQPSFLCSPQICASRLFFLAMQLVGF